MHNIPENFQLFLIFQGVTDTLQSDSGKLYS